MAERAESAAHLGELKTASLSASFPIHVLDATQPGLRFGVGEARKMGMELALREVLASETDRIVSLDADTAVAPSYVETLLHHPLRGAGFVLRFEHRLEEADNPGAIALYELFLRHMALSLRKAGSPFAYVSIGSAIGTDARHYRLCGGMPLKSATEDFHFLNKLRKLGPIEEWDDSCVYPSSRQSRRVLLGTGFFLSNFAMDREGSFEKLNIPSPAAFEQLSRTLQCLASGHEGLSEATLSDMPAVATFLERHDYIRRIDELRRNSASEAAYRARIHQVFDAMATWRLLRALAEDEPRPGIDRFLAWCAQTVGLQSMDAVDLLKAFRELGRSHAAASGSGS